MITEVPMTPGQFAHAMVDLCAGDDPEKDHAAADRLMCRVLRLLGYGSGVDLFEAMEKYYA